MRKREKLRLAEGTTKAKEQEFPGGFKGCVASMAHRKGVSDAKKLCAFIGRRAGKIPGNTTEGVGGAYVKPVVQQIGEEWCILKADGSKDVCYRGENARDQAEAEIQKRASESVLAREQEMPADDAPVVMLTSPDPVDGHTHSIIELKPDGSGMTDEAGTPPHAHKIIGFEIEPFASPDGKYKSEHPGSIPDDAAMMAEESKSRQKEGRTLHPYNVTESAPGRFRENGPKDPEGRVWEVVLIEEGMSKNGRNYSREVLEDAFKRKVFEGIPAFGFVYRTPDGAILDHGVEGVQTSDFPKDVVGFHQNVRYVETAPGKMGLVGDFHFLDDILRKKTLETWKAGNRALFGFSIDAIGEGEPLDRQRVDIKYIVRANSDDIVSFPAAGGRFVRMVASAAQGKILKEDGSMNKRALLIQLINEVKPDLLKGKDVAAMTEQSLMALIQGEEFAAVRKTFAELSGTPEKKGDTAPAPATPPAAQELAVAGLVNESRKVSEAVSGELAKIAEIRKGMERDAHKAKVETAIKEASLPSEAAQLVRDLAEKAPGDEAHLKASVARAQKLMEAGGWQDPKLTTAKVGTEKSDRIVHAIEGAMAGRPKSGVSPFRSLKEMVAVHTGDYQLGSRKLLEIASAMLGSVMSRWNEFVQPEQNKGLKESYSKRLMEAGIRKYGLKETINLAQLADIFGDSITRQMIADYQLPQLNDWRAITSKISFLDDNRLQRRDRLGQYGDLSTVAESGAYTAITSPTDEEVTYTPVKHGNFEKITEESILRNDLAWFAKIPGKLSRAALQDLRKEIWALLTGNAAIYDAVALFDAAHANTAAAVLSVANLSAARTAMRKQTAYNGSFHELGAGNLPKFLVVPPELENAANQIASSQFEPTSNLFQVANLHKGLSVIVLDQATDANDWFAVADPANIPTIEVGFVGSSDAPELWTQDDPTIGSPFDSDEIKIKVRYWFGYAVLDYRGFYGGMP